MENYADQKPLPTKTYMRKSLTMHNPPVIKSTDGKVYKATGRTKDLDFVRPKGRVYVAPKSSGVLKSEWDVLKPFLPVIKKSLDKKGFKTPQDIGDASKLFYNQVLAAKSFNGSKPVNFESIDHADSTVPPSIIDQIMTYFRSLNSGVQPNGTPLATQDKILSEDVKNVVQDLANKVGAAGLSPADAAKAGAHLSNQPPATEPFYKKPVFKWVSAGAVILIFLYLITR